MNPHVTATATMRPAGILRPSGAEPQDPGFTLIEMIVVLVVLALVGSIVLARGPMRSERLDLQAAARSVASDMRTVRSRSIDANRDLVFTVDPITRDYGQKGGLRHALPTTISVVVPVVPVVFHADGSSTGGVITLTTPSRMLTVKVDWLTGRVTVR